MLGVYFSGKQEWLGKVGSVRTIRPKLGFQGYPGISSHKLFICSLNWNVQPMSVINLKPRFSRVDLHAHSLGFQPGHGSDFLRFQTQAKIMIEFGRTARDR
ncbi:uncharacterized protein METZ01_LOCUS462236, partial [marine metagenome]